MALKLAIVLRNDSTGEVDRIFLEEDIKQSVAAELEGKDKRPFLGRGPSIVSESISALDRVERNLKSRTTGIV